MVIFKSQQYSPNPPDYGDVNELGRMWIQDGHIHVRGAECVVSIANNILETTFDGDIDPATDPEKFLAALPERYQGTYFWAEEAPDETPAM